MTVKVRGVTVHRTERKRCESGLYVGELAEEMGRVADGVYDEGRGCLDRRCTTEFSAMTTAFFATGLT